MSSPTTAAAGDELIPAANMVFDHTSILSAPPERIWPWLLQLGKHRAGWYLPARLEQLLSPSRRALRTLQPRLQRLAVGDRIPDYGGRDEWLEVAQLQPHHTLVYRTERRGRPFTWALLLDSIDGQRTRLRLRFRGEILSNGLQRHAITAIGGFFDWVTSWLMVRGLRERIAR